MKYNDASPSYPINYGVPQGSVMKYESAKNGYRDAVFPDYVATLATHECHVASSENKQIHLNPLND